MDPRRLKRLQEQEAASLAASAAAETSESDFTVESTTDASVRNRRQTLQTEPSFRTHSSEAASPTESPGPSPMQPTGAALHQPPRRAIPANSVPPGALDIRKRRDRALLAVVMHLPLWGLLALFRESVSEATDGWASPRNICVTFAVLGAMTAVAELRDWTKSTFMASMLIQGLIFGANYPSVATFPLLRIAMMLLLGYLGGQLRFSWATRPLSRRMPHTFRARSANFAKRTTGFMPFLVVGETVGCALFVPGGWLVISQSWYGYVLVFLFPFVLVQASALMTWLLTKLFGGDHKHVIGRDDVTRLQLVRWTAGVTTATVLLIGAVGYFFFAYGLYAWANQLLMSPYAALMEVLVYKGLKASARQNASLAAKRSAPGKHDQLVTDILSRKNQYNIH
jgi:hypothetical protein